MAFKLSLVSDVRGWLKGTDDVEKSIDDVADSLDDLARSTKQDADKAAAELAREFKDAFDEVKTGSRRTSRTLGDDMHDGTRKASEGVADLKDEVQQSSREMAASFDGSAESISDLVQEIAANALPALGPAGTAAGLALALGLGAGLTALQDVKDKADAAVERAHDLADTIADAGGDPRAVKWAEELRDTLKEIVDTKEWWEIWQKAPIDRLTKWTSAAKQYGVSMQDLILASAGEGDALDRINATMGTHIDQLTKSAETSSNWAGALGTNYVQLLQDAQNFTADVNAQADAVAQATEWQQAYTDATSKLSTAQADAAAASQTFTDSLTDNLSVADDGLKDFVKKGKLNLQKWSDALAERARENKTIKDFTVNIEAKLDPSAVENFAKLPTETQAMIASAYKKGSKKDRKVILSNLKAEAQVDSIDLNVSSASSPHGRG